MSTTEHLQDGQQQRRIQQDWGGGIPFPSPVIFLISQILHYMSIQKNFETHFTQEKKMHLHLIDLEHLGEKKTWIHLCHHCVSLPEIRTIRMWSSFRLVTNFLMARAATWASESGRFPRAPSIILRFVFSLGHKSLKLSHIKSNSAL